MIKLKKKIIIFVDATNAYIIWIFRFKRGLINFLLDSKC